MTVRDRGAAQAQRVKKLTLLVTIALITLVFLIGTLNSVGSLTKKPSPTHHTYRIGVCADQDLLSKKPGQNVWQSAFLRGNLVLDGNNGWSVTWDHAPIILNTTLNEKGRGAEFSELQVYNDKLYAFDDRTGAVFEVTKDFKVLPRWILVTGDGVSHDKGFKTEIATVKDGKLFVMSIGKYWTTPTGQIVENMKDVPRWIKVIDKHGGVSHINWEHNFLAMNKATGTVHPGYMIHEAAIWHPYHRSWYFLPRRFSTESYDDELDETRGSNKVIVADEKFQNIDVTTVGEVDGTRGFSSVKYLPLHHDVFMALKSQEVDGHLTTYFTLFDINTKEILIPETEILSGYKFEGVEVLPEYLH
ncbi:hypothetical protein PCE1_004997 [Barthelona sp. PCE]